MRPSKTETTAPSIVRRPHFVGDGIAAFLHGSPIRVHALKLIAAQRVMPDVSNAAATVPSANAMKTPAESPV
jgi:hypothetical protein